MFRDDLECVQRYQIFVLVAEIRVARPDVAAGLGRRRDDRARGLLVFRLEVLRDHAVLLHRVAREGIAAARVLARDSALSQLVLEARSVDEKVHCRRRLTARGHCSELSVNAIFSHLHARSELREIEEIAARRRQLVDLSLGDVRRHFGSARLNTRRSRYNLRLEHGCLRRERKILHLRRANLNDDRA